MAGILSFKEGVWKLISGAGADNYNIAHFLQEDKYDGGMAFKGMLRKARERWNQMSMEEQCFLRKVPFFPALGECMAY